MKSTENFYNLPLKIHFCFCFGNWRLVFLLSCDFVVYGKLMRYPVPFALPISTRLVFPVRSRNRARQGKTATFTTSLPGGFGTIASVSRIENMVLFIIGPNYEYFWFHDENSKNHVYRLGV